jgi:predicted methyltransferase
MHKTGREKMNGRVVLLAGAAAILAMPYGASFGAANIPAYVAAAVADTHRPKDNTDLDAARHPAEMMAFAQVKPGDKVVEFWPGGGYATRLLSKTAGPTGKVYGMNAPTFPDRLKHAVDAVTSDPEYSNVTVLEQPFDQIKIPEPVDVVWTSENYHDFQNNGPFKADTPAMDRAVFAALKPGGVFIITDYVAAPGAGKTVTQTLHRIDPDVIKQEVTAAGFVLDAQSDVLKNPSDNHTERSHQGSDQIMFRFRKPR